MASSKSSSPLSVSLSELELPEASPSSGSSSKSSLTTRTVFVRSSDCQMSKIDTHWIKYYTYNETAAGTCRSVLIVFELFARNLEPVAARAWVVKDAFCLVPCHVFNFNLVVISTHSSNKSGRRRSAVSQMVVGGKDVVWQQPRILTK